MKPRRKTGALAALLMALLLLLSGCAEVPETVTSALPEATEAFAVTTQAPAEEAAEDAEEEPAEKAEKASKATKAPKATKTPKVTKAPTEKPTKTPKVTKAPKATKTPKVTKAPTEKPTKTPKATKTPKPTNTPKPTEAPAAEETGPIIEPQAIADYLFEHGELPDNFITKKEAQALGWDSSRNYVSDVAPGKSIGGDWFGNYQGKLPRAKGRTFRECDCNYVKGRRKDDRIVWSSDGRVWFTDDHYETFTELFPSK